MKKLPKRIDNNPATAVRLPPGLKEKVKKQAEKENRTLSGLIIHSLKKYLGIDNES